MSVTVTDNIETVVERVETPATKTEVLEEIGDVVLESPTGTEETVADVLSRHDATVYETTEDLADAVRACLRADFVGRRMYDDRGPDPAEISPV